MVGLIGGTQIINTGSSFSDRMSFRIHGGVKMGIHK